MDTTTDGLRSPIQHLQFEVEERSDAVIFHCAGAFSLVTERRLDDLLKKSREFPAKRLVLDLSTVVHIDSTGVGTLAVLLKESLAANRGLVLVPSTPVRDMLTISSLDRAFKMVATLAEALTPSKV